MAVICSTDPCSTGAPERPAATDPADELSAPVAPPLLGLEDQDALLRVAREAVARGLRGETWLPDLAGYALGLREARACFVTLRRAERLRGCVGVLVARRPLAEEVAHSARGAAFRDPRFAAVSSDELATIRFHISVLGEAEPVPFLSERDLIEKLRPGVDGLTIRDGERSGTFLPEVWCLFPNPSDFLRELRLKAGLPQDRLPETTTAERYLTQSFAE